MKILGREQLEEFKRKHTETRSQVDAWYAEAKEAEWQTTHDIKRKYSSASFLKDNHVVFNIKGNKYRLKVQVNYKSKIIVIIKIGTHQEYMHW
jgi:mRNA interferase HigB